MRTILLTFLSLGIFHLTVAQSNKPCNGQGAPALTVESNCTGSTWSLADLGGAAYGTNSNDFGTPSCGSPGNPDGWFSFTAPSSGNITITTSSLTLSDVAFEVYDSDCLGPYTSEGCFSGAGMQSATLTGLTGGTTYYIRMWAETGTSGSFNICVQDDGGAAVNGCTDPNAHNYNASATNDDGTCETCSDGVRNGDETDIDCGGTNPNCPACPTCSDGIQNQGETDVDCGGPCTPCASCSSTYASNTDAFCNATNVAVGGCSSGDNTGVTHCLTASCLDEESQDFIRWTAGATEQVINFTSTGIQNADVMVVDNGGTCPGSFSSPSVIGCSTTSGGGGLTLSVTGLTAGIEYYLVIESTAADEGTFDVCIDNPSCTDGFQNQGETNVDCGGPCTACGTNEECNGSTQVTCGNTYSGTTVGASANDNGTCGTSTGTSGGVWYQFVGNGDEVLASLCGSSFDTKINVFSGTCGSLTCVGGTDDGGSCSTQSEYTFQTSIGTIYYIYVHGFSSNEGSYQLAISCTTPPAPDCATIVSPTDGASGLCLGEDIEWSAALTGGTPSDYYVYLGTDNPPTNILNGVSTTSTSYDPGTLSPNTTYYWQIAPSNVSGTQTSGSGMGACSIWSFTTGAGSSSNDDPCNATSITPVAGCSYTTYSNFCATNTSSVTSPGCGSYSGADVWFSTVVPASGTLQIDTETGVITDGAMAVYRGTCSSLTLIECDDDGSENGAMPYISRNDYVPGETIWIRFWEFGGNLEGDFGICVVDPCPAGPPSNDDCSTAVPLTVGVYSDGETACATATGEPSAPSCWSGTDMNTVWYTVVAPASGELIIATDMDDPTPSSFDGTQIEVFSGMGCGSLSSLGCNNDAGCGDVSTSSLQLTGLSSGNTYYIRVDGEDSEMPDFTIVALDPTNTSSFSPGSECGVPQPVCSATFNIGDPGYQGIGVQCDFGGTNNCTSGERGSGWYTIEIANTGTLELDIVPNDWSSGITCGDETDYDFVIWKIDGSGATDCASIESSGGGSNEACNFNYLGVTGLSASGLAPSTYGSCYDGAYEPALSVTAGETYLISIQNYSNSTSGFTLDISNSATELDTTSNPLCVNVQLSAKLTMFTGEKAEGYNLLKWRTVVESNHDYFELLRSFDGKDFEVIDKIPSKKGTSFSVTDYEYKDQSVHQTAYYRLVNVSESGERHSSKTVVIHRNEVVPQIYPNPANESFYVSYQSEGEAQLRVMSISGALLKQAVLPASTSNVTSVITLDGLGAGTYLVEVKTSSTSITHKLIVKD